MRRTLRKARGRGRQRGRSGRGGMAQARFDRAGRAVPEEDVAGCQTQNDWRVPVDSTGERARGRSGRKRFVFVRAPPHGPVGAKARLCRKIRTGAQEEAIRIDRDVRELTQILFGRRWGGRPLIHSRNKKAAHRLKLAPRLSATVATIRRSLSDALKRVHAVASGCAAGMSWVHFSKMD